ncbi:SGNH/GDSL hydrolase family protein [Rubritalea profundi]|uniref:SGNH/GDSL hydrolase family protein n=1 Tax=Rubritalea profundi TaxID=1658618 RepID=UPI000CF38137|nr:SGNH/GDSL hydrolase family protein [Rubritalea profundi]
MNKLTAFLLAFTALALPAHVCAAEPSKNDAPHPQKAFVNPKDDPDLLNVLIIGDSISIRYTTAVRKLLHGKADVFRPGANCMYSGHRAQSMKAWVANRKWDVIHFNFGIWDTHYLHNGKLIMPNNLSNYKEADLKRRYSHQQYIKNLEKVLKVVKRTKAKLIWASTTPFISYG